MYSRSITKVEIVEGVVCKDHLCNNKDEKMSLHDLGVCSGIFLPTIISYIVILTSIK
jgi:hypothetical protein